MFDKILLVGSDQQWSIERLYKKYLSEAGLTVELFSAQDLFYKFYNRSVAHKIIFRSGFSSIYKDINKQLIIKADNFQPQFIWIFKGMEIYPATIAALKKRNVKVVGYNPDNPFLFTGKGSGNENVSGSIGLYDLHFTYSLEIKKQLEEKFGAFTSYLPFGYDIPEELYQSCGQEKELLKSCFLGNPDPQRVKFINELAEQGIELDIFGNFWGKYIRHKNVQVYPPVYGDAFYKTLFKYRVQLNMMRIHNLHSHNMRSFEIPAIGGIQLAPDTPEHRLFFEEGSEIFLYNSMQECIQNIHGLLSLSSAEALEVRRRARLRSVHSGYSYRNRTLQVVGVLNEWDV